MFGRLWDSICYSLNAIRYVIPFALVIGGLYLLYIRNVRNDFQRTISDVEYMNRNIYLNLSGPKKGLTNDSIVYSNVLPLDMERKQLESGFKITHRFNGDLKFTEAFANKDERTLFLALRDNKERYNQISSGLGAYIMTFMNLSRSQCILMAMHNWRNVSSNYLGMEVSRINPQAPYVGIYNLNYYILFDNKDETFDTKDTGTLSRSYLNQQQAEKACDCLLDECMISLKFY